MGKKEYKLWVETIFKRTAGKNKKTFLEAIELAGSLKKTDSIGHHIETSFNSQEGLSLIKLIHVFHYSVFWDGRNYRELIDCQALADFIKKINKKYSQRFNYQILKALFSIPLAAGKKNDVIALTFDFDTISYSFNKISLHFNPAKKESILEICRFLNFGTAKTASVKLQNLQFIGIDFFNDGRCSLKLYREIERLPSVLKKREDAVRRISKEVKIRTMLALERLSSRQSFLPRDIYLSPANLSGGQLRQLPFLGGYFDFLISAGFFIKNFRINWIAIKNNKLELYFL